MDCDWVIVDGYSLLHRAEEYLGGPAGSLEAARWRVLRVVEDVAAAWGQRTTIVFDGRGAAESRALESEIVEIVYSPGHLTADTVIERLVHRHAHPERILVVSSDRAELETISAEGAHGISCGHYLEQCDEIRKRVRARSRTARRRTPPPTLGDFFPHE